MNNDFINKQLSQLESLKGQCTQLKGIFDNSMNEVLKNVPNDQKQDIFEIQNAAKKAFDLSKDGKIDEAINLTKDLTKRYTNGG